MPEQPFGNTWQERPEDIIILRNRTQHNFILELPSGRYRLDAGRRMRTVRSILKLSQVKELIDTGQVALE